MPNDTLLKLSSRLPKASSLDGHADKLHGELGKHCAFAGEFRIADITEVDPSSDGSPKVKIEIMLIEVVFGAEIQRQNAAVPFAVAAIRFNGGQWRFVMTPEQFCALYREALA
jgi:hypothetical protein